MMTARSLRSGAACHWQAAKKAFAPALLGMTLPCAPALAKVGADEAAKLGTVLTPNGAEKAGNAAGTIPAWDGGMPKAELKRGDNPFTGDKPLYTVTAASRSSTTIVSKDVSCPSTSASPETTRNRSPLATSATRTLTRPRVSRTTSSRPVVCGPGGLAV